MIAASFIWGTRKERDDTLENLARKGEPVGRIAGKASGETSEFLVLKAV
jgi:hypothetical protein